MGRDANRSGKSYEAEVPSPSNAAVALQDLRGQLEPLLDISPSAIVITDLESNVMAWNPAAEELFGYTAREAIGRNLDDLVAATEKLHEAAVAFSRRARDREEIRTLTRRTRKDGTLVDVELRAAPLMADGTHVGNFGIYHDVTELHRQKRFYEALLDVSPAAIVAIDPDDNVTLWNPAAERLFGYTPEEAVGRNVDDLVATDTRIREEAERLNRTVEGRQIRIVGQRTRKDGSLVDVELLGAPVKVGDDLVGRYAIYLDLSEVQRRRQYYESLVELSPTAITTVDPNDVVTSWNPAAERLFGYTADEAIGRNIDSLVANREDIRDEALAISDDIAERQVRLSARRTRKDGSLVDVDVAAAPIFVAGELVGKYALYHDITELQEQRRYLESLLDLSPTAIVVIGRDGRVTSWNSAAEELFGYTAEEAIGQELDDLVANRPDLHEEGARNTEAALRGERVHEFARRTRKDGSLVDVELLSEQIVVGTEARGFLAIYHDITELQRQRQYFEAVLQLSPTAIVTVDEEFRIASWNPAAEELFGYTAGEARGQFIDDLVAASPDLREEAAAMNQAGAAGERARAIGRRTRKDGSLVDVEIVAGPVYVGDERVGHSVIYHDISEIQRQKRYYEALVEVSPVAVVLMDNDGTITSWSPAAERLFGYAPDEAIGRSIFDVVTGERTLREEAEGFFRRMQAGEATFSALTRRTRKDGSLVDVEILTAPVMIGGDRAGFYVLYHDISEIQRQRQYYERLVETSPVAVVLVEADGKTVRSWNPAAERLFGYTPEEAIGRNIEDLVTSGDDMRAEAASYGQTLREDQSIHAVTTRTRKDGSVVNVEVLGVPVMLGGRRVGDYVLYHDIGELQRARLEAEAATRAKSAFLATMSHEIRTPLNAVIGMTGLLLDTELTSEQRGFGEIIRTSGDALLAVINEILDFSKIEAGRLDLEHQPFRLRECVESALELVANAAADKSLDLAYVVDPQTPASIVGDFARLRQILLNLLNNAVKFTEHGEVVLRVNARRIGDGAGEGSGRYEIHFAIRDTGIGIHPDRLDRLFEAFTQVDASTTRRYGGTGLGLAICKRLAEEMNGRIWATSRVGEGSTFHVSIEADAAGGPLAADELETIPELAGKRVLIVDDNATNREILRRQAESWGMVPQETALPSEALDHLGRGDGFDLAILDMQMPEMDGRALADEIRRLPGGEGLPLVMLTSLGRRDSSPDDARFAAFLTKPIRPSQLYDALVGIFAPEMAPQRVSRPEARPAAPPPRARTLRILLAEDNAVNQRVALLLLEKLGYRADVAGDGREALEALERQAYDVVLMDVQMPEMDGLEATGEILRRWPGPDRPRIIAMTAGATEADREACLAAGMDDYVSKPIRREELDAALARSAPVDGTASARPILDPDAMAMLLETVGSEEALADVTEVFLQDTARTLSALRADVRDGRAAEVRRNAHALKSTAASFGASHLSDLCRRLEDLGRSEHLEDAAPIVDAVAAEFATVRKALEDLRR